MPCENAVQHTLVIDAGGTKTRMALWNGAVISDTLIFDTLSSRSPKLTGKSSASIQKAWILDLATKIEQYRTRHPFIRSIIMAFAGIVASDGTLGHSPNIWGTDAAPLSASDLEQAWGIPIRAINDMTAAVTRYGKNERYAHCRRIMLLTISSGIGSKIYDIEHDSVIIDEKGRAGELGQVSFESTHVIDNEFPLSGKLEEYVSGIGIEKLADALSSSPSYEKLYDSSLIKKKRNETMMPFSHLLLTCVDAADLFSMILLRKSIALLAQVLQVVILQSAPDAIIIVGGFARNGGERYRSILVEELIHIGVHGYSPEELDALIIRGTNDDHDGLIGAALLLGDKNL